MRRPLVGVTPLYDEARKSDWMLPGYLEGVMEAGGLPVMLPLTADLELLEQLAETVDGVLLTGGHDVSPALYGQSPLSACGACCLARDEMERLLLPLLWAQDKPILGICRGIQFLNIYFGGTLYQDIPVECGVIHSDVVHKVRLEEGTWMRDLFDSAELVTNSHHHQGVKKLADDFIVAARSEDGMVEAAIHKTLPIFATQFHPERMIGDWRPEEQTDMTVIFDKFMDMVGRG